jgi:acetylornithine deacetylase/succinyl-diaminopimelate desuccinylase-like protein
MRPEIERQVLNSIDQRRDAIIAFLQELISFPSVTGDELEIQRFLARKLRQWD